MIFYGSDDSSQHSSTRLLRRLVSYIMRYPSVIATALFFLVLGAITTLSLPLAFQRIIDDEFQRSHSVFFGSHFVTLVVISFFLAFASALRHYFIVTLGERVAADLRRDVFSSIVFLSPAFFDKVRPTVIMTSLVADTVQIRAVIISVASFALRNFILGLSSVVMMLVTSIKLSSLVLAAIPIVVLPLVFLGRFVREQSRQTQDVLSSSMAFASERVSDIRTVQSFTAETEIVDRFNLGVEKAFDASRKTSVIRSLLIFSAIFMVFSSISGIFWLGSRDVYSGSLSPGTMTQFLLYALLAAASFGSLSEIWTDLLQATSAFERLIKILDEKTIISSPAVPRILPNETKGLIQFDHVTFAYPVRPDIKVLRGLSFFVYPGETVAFVGPSGSGKSTLFSLLQRFYDPQEGSVFLDGVNIKEADVFALRCRMALAPQDVTIFSASIKDNIALGDPRSSLLNIQHAARLALVDEFTSGFPEGLDTLLGERGVGLSGGQRQRIAIARAILKNAPVLLLDEATSSLDAQSEHYVQTALHALMKDKTTLVIAHRLSTIMKADRILVIVEGQIVEEGTHSSLIEKNGVYANLARMQFNSK